MRIRSLYKKLLESYGKHAAYHFTRDIVLCSLFKAHRAINIVTLMSVAYCLLNFLVSIIQPLQGQHIFGIINK
jgi:hypothetical protein